MWWAYQHFPFKECMFFFALREKSKKWREADACRPIWQSKIRKARRWFSFLCGSSSALKKYVLQSSSTFWMDEPGCFGIWKFSVVHPKELNYVPALFSSVPLPTLLNCDPRWRRKISTCRYSWSSPVPSLIVLLGNGAPRHFGSTNLPETRKKTSQARPDMRSQLVLSKSTMISDRRSEYTLENERLELKNGGDRVDGRLFYYSIGWLHVHVTGWWFQPMKNIGQNRNLPPNRDEHKKHVKPPPRLILHGGSKGKTSSNSKTQTQSPRCYQIGIARFIHITHGLSNKLKIYKNKVPAFLVALIVVFFNNSRLSGLLMSCFCHPGSHPSNRFPHHFGTALMCFIASSQMVVVMYILEWFTALQVHLPVDLWEKISISSL